MQTVTFHGVLDAIESLSTADQEALIALIQRRLADRRRDEIAKNIAQSKAEYASDQVFRGSVEDVMAELER
jgi:predicted transcriptional regulator